MLSISRAYIWMELPSLYCIDWNVHTGSTSKNIHVQEERGQTILSDSVGWDEEDKFSGVGIIGEVPDMKLKSSSVILQNSASSECAAIDSSMDCLDPVSESDQTDLEGGQKKKEHKLNADAAEWKPPSHIGQSKAIESCRQLNQPDEIVSDYPPFSPLNIYGLQVSNQITQEILIIIVWSIVLIYVSYNEIASIFDAFATSDRSAVFINSQSGEFCGPSSNIHTFC